MRDRRVVVTVLRRKGSRDIINVYEPHEHHVETLARKARRRDVPLPGESLDVLTRPVHLVSRNGTVLEREEIDEIKTRIKSLEAELDKVLAERDRARGHLGKL